MGTTLVLTPEQRAQYEAKGLIWWYEAAYLRNFGPIHPEKPQPGFYRTRDGALAPWVPADIWLDEHTGELRAVKGFPPNRALLEADEIKRVWPMWAKEPVTYEVHEEARRAGTWPVATGGLMANAADLPDKPTGFESLKDAISRSTTEALEWLKSFDKDELPDKAAADRAALLAERIRDYRNKADKERLAESRPYYDKWTAINARWNDDCGIKLAERVADRLQKAARAWADRERRRREAEALAKLKETQSVEAMPVVGEVTLASAKNKAGARRVQFAEVLLITSYDEVRKFFQGTAEYKAAMEAAEKAILEELANKAWKKGVVVPGTKEDKQAA